MENQQIFNVAIVIAGFLAGWVLNNISRAITRLEDEIHDFPHIYVSKDDYKLDIAEIKNMLHDIYKELRQKADK